MCQIRLNDETKQFAVKDIYDFIYFLQSFCAQIAARRDDRHSPIVIALLVTQNDNWFQIDTTQTNLNLFTNTKITIQMN